MAVTKTGESGMGPTSIHRVEWLDTQQRLDVTDTLVISEYGVTISRQPDDAKCRIEIDRT